MNNLQSLRSKLDSINIDLIQALLSRQQVITDIFSLKEEENIGAWNPEREKEIYSNLEQSFGQLNLPMVLVFSLIIEEQASQCGAYPLWSRREHLSSFTGMLEELTNPVFLKAFNQDQYEKLDLKEKYKI